MAAPDEETTPLAEPAAFEVAWWLSGEGPDRGFHTWQATRVPELRVGEAVWLRIAATNYGDLIDLACANLVVPFDLTALQWNPRSGVYTPALTGCENAEVGFSPEHRVKYFTQERTLPRRFTWVSTYLLVATVNPVPLLSLLFEVDDRAWSKQKLRIVTGR